MNTGATITLAILAAYLLTYGMAVLVTGSMGDKREFWGIVIGLLLFACLLNQIN